MRGLILVVGFLEVLDQRVLQLTLDVIRTDSFELFYLVDLLVVVVKATNGSFIMKNGVVFPLGCLSLTSAHLVVSLIILIKFSGCHVSELKNSRSARLCGLWNTTVF